MIVFDLLLLTFTQSYLPHFYYEKKDSTKTLRESIQNNVYKFILIFLVISVIVFAVQDQGFFFNIKLFK